MSYLAPATTAKYASASVLRHRDQLVDVQPDAMQGRAQLFKRQLAELPSERSKRVQAVTCATVSSGRVSAWRSCHQLQHHWGRRRIVQRRVA